MKSVHEHDDRMDIAVRRLMVEGDQGGAFGASHPLRRDLMIKQAMASTNTKSILQPQKVWPAKRTVAVLVACSLAIASAAVLLLNTKYHSQVPSGEISVTADAVDDTTNPIVGYVIQGQSGITIEGNPVKMSATLSSKQDVDIQTDGTVVALGSGIQLAPTKGSSFTVDNDDEKRLVLSLERGAVWSSVDPAKARTGLRVATPNGIVTVKGTVFGVAIEGDATTVTVLRGAVEVSVPGVTARTVSAKQRYIIGSRDTESLDTTAQNSIWKHLVQLGLSARDAVKDEPTAAPEKKEKRSTREKNVPSIESLLTRIRKLRLARDWRGVESAYTRLIRFHFKTDHARTAMISLGTIRLEKLDDPAGALGAFSSYLESGAKPLAPEALYGKACALGALGDFKKERDTLEKFVKRFPSGPQVPAAKDRLAELSN